MSPGNPIRAFLAPLLLVFLSHGVRAFAAHSAYVAAGYDAFLPQFSGTPSPAGSYDIDIVNGNPGFFNGISGGSVDGQTGTVLSYDPQFPTPDATVVLALAINVTDSAGAGHSLSALNDPALNDIIDDLNASSFSGPYAVTAFAFDAAPAQYNSVTTALSAGESANHGQPFDILLSISNTFGLPFPDTAWGCNFANEVGNLDGITSLSITDAGGAEGPFVPEPASASMLLLSAVALMARKRHA